MAESRQPWNFKVMWSNWLKQIIWNCDWHFWWGTKSSSTYPYLCIKIIYLTWLKDKGKLNVFFIFFNDLGLRFISVSKFVNFDESTLPMEMLHPLLTIFSHNVYFTVLSYISTFFLPYIDMLRFIVLLPYIFFFRTNFLHNQIRVLTSS